MINMKLFRRMFHSSSTIQTLYYNEWMTNSHQLKKCFFSKFITSAEYKERQRKLVALVESKPEYQNKNSLMLIASAQRSFQADTKIPNIYYKQNSDFTYFTGLNNIDSVNCVLAILGGNGEHVESILFTPFVDDHQLIWEGPGLNELNNISICDNIRDVKELNEFIKANQKRQMFISKYGLCPGTMIENDSNLMNINYHLSNYIDELRLIKSNNELKSMRRTCLIGSNALKETIKWTNQFIDNYLFINENQISAKFDFECRMNGANKISYPSVCATGENSTIIHYGKNDRFAKPNDWILMDAGCEDIEGYCSDISRSWQLNGEKQLSRLQFALYQALQHVHQELISSFNESTTLDQLFQLMCHLNAKVLIEFGIGKKFMSSVEAFRLAYHHCPHHVSHYIGLDIHDTPSISRSIPMKSGMCFTIEPGLYFRKSDDINPEFHGIGLRIEDDFCINEEGKLENLTKNCPL